MTMITIRPMTKDDIYSVAKIHSEAFPRQFASKQWVSCNFNAYPRILMYVAMKENVEVVGYIFNDYTKVDLEKIQLLSWNK